MGWVRAQLGHSQRSRSDSQSRRYWDESGRYQLGLEAGRRLVAAFEPDPSLARLRPLASGRRRAPEHCPPL